MASFKCKLAECYNGELEEGFSLVTCPNCGAEVAVAAKSWPVSFEKQTTRGAAPLFYVGVFECPKCKSRFRSKVESTAKTAETISVKSAVEKIEVIRAGLVQSLKTLRERMRILELERAGLMGEIEELKKAAELRVDALEDEVSQLREEIKSLKELLGSTEQSA